PLAGDVRVGPAGTSDRITTWTVVVRVSSALAAWTVSVYVPGGVSGVLAIRMVDVVPLVGGVGTGSGSNVAVISPPVGGVGFTPVTLSVTGLTNRPAPPSTVTVAIAVVPRQVSPAAVATTGVAAGLVTTQSFSEFENSVWTS